MKLHVMSDLHLEFGDMKRPPGGEVLILAGDIHVGDKATDFIEDCLYDYDQVYYVLGNHEFYGCNMQRVRHWWQEAAKNRENFEVLDNTVHAYGGVRFIGTTQWTYAKDQGLSDYSLIGFANRILTLDDTVFLHREAKLFLEDTLAQPWSGETVVITHHAPIPECVVPKWQGNEANSHFHANLNYLMEEYDIAYWFHGHMHDSIFIEYEGTCVVCNPRGYYGHGANHGFRNPLEVEV